MIFPSEIEQRLGFDQIRLKLINYCQGPLGVQQVEQMEFSSVYANILTLLRQNFEFKLILESGKEFPSTFHSNPEEHFKRAAIEGSYLEEEAFQEIIKSLQIISGCKHFFKQHEESYPELFRISTVITDPGHLIKTLIAKFDDHGLIRDNASVELSKIRRSLHAEQNRVKRLMDQLFRNAADQGWVPEGVSAAIRDGRLVIPVACGTQEKNQRLCCG